MSLPKRINLRNFLVCGFFGFLGVSLVLVFTLEAEAKELDPIAPNKKLRVVVFGAHPDDPESGCGGLIAMLTKSGNEVLVAYATCFRGTRKIGGEAEAVVRRREAAEACKLLGAKPYFFDFAHEKLQADEATLQLISIWLKKVKPHVVVTHWPLDTHPNHHVTSSLVWQCYLKDAPWSLYFFEVMTDQQTLNFKPDLYLNIEAVAGIKKKALDCHKSQEPEAIWKVHEAMARQRGSECGKTLAEAYIRVDSGRDRPKLPVAFLPRLTMQVKPSGGIQVSPDGKSGIDTFRELDRYDGATKAVDQSHPLAAPGVTSLTDKSVKYTVPKEHFVQIKRAGITAVVVDNEIIDSPLRRKRSGKLSGIVSLRRGDEAESIYNLAGLNFEHIHDGTAAVKRDIFEPRTTPMELRKIDEHTVELYQAPTPYWRLESCGRYHLLADGAIEYTFECIPRAAVFKKGYIGLFWANYIFEPEDRAIHFIGRTGDDPKPHWVRAVTPEHGQEATHPPSGPLVDLKLDPEFPLKLVSGRSRYTYAEPWYYGVSRGHALVLMFRGRDRIWFAQSPNSGSKTSKSPAWDFQWFVPHYKVGEAYGFVMRTAYIPFENQEQVLRATRSHRQELNGVRK